VRAFLVLALVALGCGESGPSGDVPERLSAWGLFADPLAQAPAEGVEPYAPVSPLFSDYTAKHRFIRLPEGVPAGYTAEGPWDFPEGTVLVKTFAFPADRRDPSAGERLVETRLLVLEDGEWEPYVYLWEGDDAHYEPAGARVPVSWVHDDGAERSLTYRVPNTSQCAECHGGIGDTLPLGPRTQQMDHDGQLAALEAAGVFAEPVPTERPMALVDPFGDAPLAERARSYLHGNCGHCHREGGAAGQSGLWLTADVTDDLALGLCKRPVAAGHAAGGHSFDIVPGAPDESVMIYRMESTEPGVKMPELPNQLVDEAGVALVREWIASMSPEGC
tara:strand:+ start:2811 stop:3809 length:999 start_codon:yes stop_codon:yes gene_type:complete